MNKHLRISIYIILKISIALAFAVSFETAKAQDAYNFYFVKSQKEQSKNEVKEKPRPFVNEEAPKASRVKTELDFEKKPRSYKSWEASLGIGQLSGETPVNFVPMEDGFSRQGMRMFNQELYVLGGRYYFNRYFDVHGSLHLPKGEIDVDTSDWRAQSQKGSLDSTFDFQILVGGGVTPFHFDFLGFTFMEIGLDLSFLVGDENYLGGNSSALVWGPRVAINLSHSLSVIFNAQIELQRDFGDFLGGYNSMRVAYRW